MSSRSSAGKPGQNNIDRVYNLTRWLSFQTEQMEKRFTLDFIQRQRLSFIGIILFNVSNIVYGFLSINSLTSILFPILKWLMVFCLIISVGIMYLHKSYIEKNFTLQILIRLSSFYFYCSQYLSVDHLEMGKSATLFMSSALAVSIHMVFTNLLTIPHWKRHLLINIVYFSIVQLIVYLSSRESTVKLNIIYFIFSQAGLNIFTGFFERFVREFWIHLDVSKKQSAQLQNVIDELPQPLLVLDSQCDVLLSNFTALKFFQSILPNKENEVLPRNVANNPSKILQRLSPQDLKLIEDLVKQVKESEKICSVTFQKQIKNLKEPEKEESKQVQLTLIGSRIQWKTQVCTFLQVQEAEKIVEKEIEQKTITIEKVYEIQNPSGLGSGELQRSERDHVQSSRGNNMSDSAVTSIQLVQYPQMKPQKVLTQVDNVYSFNFGGNSIKSVSLDQSIIRNKNKKPKKIESPDQSPINFVSPIEKSSYDMSHLTSTQDNSEGEVNINIDDEIYKHFNFIESGLSNLLAKIISQIQGIKGKKINLSFGSLENSPNVGQYSISGSHHNMSGNKVINISQNVSGQFYSKNQDQKEPSSPLKQNKGDPKINKKILSTILNLKQSDIQLQQNQINISQQNQQSNVTRIQKIIQDSDQIVLPDDSDPENNDNKNYITEADESALNSPININQLDDLSPSSLGSNRIAEINEELEDEVTTTNLSSRRKQIDYKYNEKCTILLFEESSNTRMTIPYHKYDHPTKFNTFSEGEAALSAYFDNINEGILFNFMVLGIEAKNGIDGVEIATKIRNHEKFHKVPRTHLVAIFNSVGSEVGGQTKSADTYLFKGFDQAFEKPINKTVMNDIILQRINPQTVYQNEEDYIQKYKYFDKFTLLVCDDDIQSAMTFKEYSLSSDIEAEVAKSEKSVLNIYYSTIQSGRLYQILLIGITTLEKQNDIVKQIREYENEKKIKKTYIVGMYYSFQNKNINISEKLNELGLNEIMLKPIEREDVQRLVEKVKKNIEQENKELSSPQKKIQIKLQRSPTQGQFLDMSKNQNFTFTKMSTQKTNKTNEVDMDELELKAASNLFKKTKESGVKIGGGKSFTDLGTQSIDTKQESERQNLQKVQQNQFKANDNQIILIKDQSDFDELELKANIFSKVKQQGLKIGEEPQKQNQQSNKYKPSEDDDDLELKQANKLFGNINKKGIKIGGESTTSTSVSSSITNSKIPQQQSQQSNATSQQLSQLKMPASVQQQNNKYKPTEDDDDLELKHASNLFSNINKKGIKIGGGESKASEPANTQSNKPSQLQTQPQKIQSSHNNDQVQESPYTSSKNSPSSQSSQTKIKPKDILASVQIFDQFKKNQAKQQTQEEPSKIVVQQIPQPQQTSPNTQKHVQPKQILHKQDNHKQSPVMNISQLSRSPVQSFGKTPNSQIGFQIMANKPVNPYKYNEKPTFLVMEDSSLVMMNISFMKYDIPKVLETCTTGEVALEKYMNNVKNHILYHFIILGVNTEKGMNGNEVMKKIRQYEQEHNIPRTHMLASYNAITSEIGGQILNKEIFVFRGFDDALEKPIKAIDMNTLLKSRASPQIMQNIFIFLIQLIDSKKEDISMKFRFFDRFTILVCDETDQITLTVNSLEVENMEKPIFTWNGQSLYNKYMSSVQGGRIYSFIITGVRVLDLKKEDVVQKIRQYEKENNAPKTYIIGYMKMNQKQQNVDELIQEGYSEIIDSGIQQSDLIKIITRLKLTLKLQQ